MTLGSLARFSERRFPTSDFDSVVARHVAAALRRENSPEDAEPDAEEEGEVVVRTASSLTPTTDGRDNCVEMTYLLHLLLSLNFSTEECPGDDAGKDAAETGWMELRAQPGGAWAFFVSVFASEELDGEHRSFKMPVDLVIKHMRSDDGTEDDSITLQTFDFAGQEEYHMLHHLFLSNKGLYLVVFDLSLWADESGDDRTSEEALTFWICSVHCHAPESRMLLVGTHVDMLGAHKMAILDKVDRRIHELLERNQALNEQLVVNTAEELCFFPIDNRRRGRQSVESLRVKIDETAAEICTTGFLSKALPLYWLRYQTELIRLARAGPDRFWGTASVEGTMPAAGASSSGPPKPVHALPFSQVSRLGRAVGIHDEGELLSVLIYLHDTGSIIFFDEEKLRDCVVLDPYWLAEAAANIFNCPRVVQGRSASARRLLERGELHVDLLRQHLWRSERFVDHIPVLINLMLRFDLLVSSSDQDVFVVPFLLPFKTGGYEPPGEGSLSFDFHGMLTRLLPTVFPRLIASAAKMPSLRLTHSRVYKDSCTIFLGTRRLAFELLPPGRPEMIAVRRLAGSEDGAESDGEESGGLQLPLDLAKQVISLVHESTSEWLPHLSFTAGVLCPHCHRSGAPHVIDVSELSEVVICSRTHEPVTLAKAGWAFRWRQEVLTSGGASRKSSDVILDLDVEELRPTAAPRHCEIGNLWLCDDSSEEAADPEPPEPPAKLARPPSLPGVERRTVPIPIVTSSEALPAPSPGSPHPGEETPASPSMPDQVGLLYFLYASPLTVDTIDVRAELQLLREALRAGQTTGGDQNDFKAH
ncbi:pats1 [Symbiodinium sp. KB8]|nr:pats1 [Symbiodinium sp. KB8]